MARGSKVGAKAKKLKQKAKSKFIKTTTKINIKAAKARGREQLKRSKRAGR